MEPFRYRKAYEAMIHASQLLENRISYSNDGAADGSSAEQPILAPSMEEDEDSMEWTPTGTLTPPTGCGPPPSTSKSLRHLLPEGGEGEYRLQDKGDNAVLLHKLKDSAIMDECIDKLVRDMPDVLNYDDSASCTVSTIEVPKDFGLHLSISINHHLAQVADRKQLEKYTRLLGYRKDNAKKKSIKLGFDPSDLIKREAVTFPKDSLSQVSTLDNEIHPIFRIENFHGCPDGVYEVLKPALRLTTLLLFSRATARFWHTLVFGDRKPCAETSEKYGQPCCRITEDVAWTEKNAASFKAFLDNQVDTLHFIFHRDPLRTDPAYASMGLVSDYKNGLMRRLDHKCHTSRICLHSDFYTTAKKLSTLRFPDYAMVLRFNLFLAVCLAHEMAHFVEVSGPHHEHPLGEPEVFFNDNTWTESGIVFELKVFGARLHPIESRVDCLHGIAVLNYPLKELYDKEDNILYTLPMEYITNIQQKETWADDLSNPQSDLFIVPRTGGRSIEINGTNLMVWEDEKDADISDHIDGKNTVFHRMDDGQIVRNPSLGNRKPTKHLEGRRFNPYNRLKKSVSATSSNGEQTEEATQVNGNGNGNGESNQEKGRGSAGNSDRDDEML